MFTRNAIVAVLFVGAAGPVWAEASGDVLRGQAYTNAMCGSCHSLTADTASTNPAAPPFRSAKLDFKTGEEFATFLNTKHPVMPTPIINAKQAGDMMTYIATLQPEKTN
jgi:hypothetical protein